MIAKQAEITGKYKSQRPAKKDRLFTSQAVEAEILRVKNLLTNSKLAWMFENCFPNTLETTVHYRTTDGKPDTFVYTGDIHGLWLRVGSSSVAIYPATHKDPGIKENARGRYPPQFKVPISTLLQMLSTTELKGATG